MSRVGPTHAVLHSRWGTLCEYELGQSQETERLTDWAEDLHVEFGCAWDESMRLREKNRSRLIGLRSFYLSLLG